MGRKTTQTTRRARAAPGETRGRAVPGETRARVLSFVRECVERGRPPSVREVQAALGLRAVESARAHLEQLVAEGKLAKEQGVARGYRLAEGESAPVRCIPLLGRVQAGALSEAIDERARFDESASFADRDDVVPIDTRRLRGRTDDLFALRVRGASMRDAGILDGDLVIVRARARAEHGDIVVARIDSEATVKRLVVARGRVELHPANPDFAPIVPRAGEELAILGRVIEVRRHLPV